MGRFDDVDDDDELVEVRVRIRPTKRGKRRVRMPGLCPRCERWHRVMHDGNLVMHHLDDHGLCPGSGHPPEKVH